VTYFYSLGNLQPPEEITQYLDEGSVIHYYHQTYEDFNSSDADICVWTSTQATKGRDNQVTLTVMSDSYTLIVSRRSSELTANYFPPIELSPHKQCALALVELQTFNAIPNIDEGRNKLYMEGEEPIIFPTTEVTKLEISTSIPRKKSRVSSSNRTTLYAARLNAPNPSISDPQTPSDLS